MRNSSLIKNHSLLDNPFIPIQDLNTNFHLKPKNRKAKFDIEENVMSELVKMPVRHFLRSDYLHIFFYIQPIAVRIRQGEHKGILPIVAGVTEVDLRRGDQETQGCKKDS